MKIKNFKCTLQAIGLSAALSLVGCSNQNSNGEYKEYEKSIEYSKESNVVKDNHQKIKVLTKDEIKEITNEIDNLVYSCYYDSWSNELSLSNKRYIESNYEDYEISDTTYSNMNLLLNQDLVTSLRLEYANFDLSKLDISNLEEVTLYNIKLENAKQIMKVAYENNIKLNYILNDIDIEDSLKVIKYIIKNDIACNSLYLTASTEQELIKFCDLAEKIGTKEITFLLNPHLEIENSINVNTKLNDKTSSFNLKFCHLFSEELTGDKKLGNIEINSNNQSLSVGFSDAIITKDTRISVPDNCDVSIYGRCTDVIPLYELRKVSELYYYDSDLYKGFKSTWPEFETYNNFVEQIKDEHAKTLVK